MARPGSTWALDSRSPDERGSALILALFFTMLAAGIVTVGTMMEHSTRAKTRTNFRLHSQAHQFARAGLAETISWFRRQTSQPVAAFAPVIDFGVDPPIIDTDEPQIGIVREFEIEGKVWGRYEVWKTWEGDPDPDRLAWRRQMQVRDVSEERRTGGGGTCWRLRSIGYVFERSDLGARFDEAPNRVVAIEVLETEIVRRRLSPPGQAALTVAQGSTVLVGTNGRIVGGSVGAGVYYPSGSGMPSTGPSGSNRVTGNPPLAQAPGAIDLSCPAVFGITFADLRSSADHVVATRAAMPVPVPDRATIVIDAPSFTFDRDVPLAGFGLVYVRGDCTIAVGSGSRFNGLLYVEGNLVVHAPCEIEGAIVVTGSVTMSGSGDYATFRFNDELLNTLRQSVGQYRFSGPYRPVHGQL